MLAFILTIIAGAGMGAALDAVGYEVTDIMFWVLLIPTLIFVNWAVRIFSA